MTAGGKSSGTGTQGALDGEPTHALDGEPTHVFLARGTGEFIGINTENPEEESYPLPGDGGELPVVIEGEVYPDGS